MSNFVLTNNLDVFDGPNQPVVVCALGQKACRDGYSALYTRAAALSCDLAIARADGSLRHLLARLSRIDVAPGLFG